MSGAGGYAYSDPGVRWIYLSQLAPNQIASKLTGDMLLRNEPDLIGVLLFDLSFYRDTDGKGYTKRCSFYVEGDRIFTKQTFADNQHFQELDKEIARHLGKARVMFKSAGPYQKE